MYSVFNLTDESCSRCEGLRNERDSARRENQTLNRKIQELNNIIKEKSEYYQQSFENLATVKKDQEQRIRQLGRENKELKEEVTKKKSEVDKMRKKNKKLKDSRDKFRAEVEAIDVELQNMTVENKCLHEKSRAERSMCGYLREEVRRLRKMPGRKCFTCVVVTLLYG